MIGPLLLAVLLSACGANQALPADNSSSCHPSPPLPNRPSPRPVHNVHSWDLRTKVDILFMIDNSSGPAELLQSALKSNIARLFDPLRIGGSRADLHVGVVSSDYGAGASGAPGCTPSGPNGGGDQGRLIALGSKAAAGCQRPRAANFIEIQYGEHGPLLHNLPGAQTLEETFGCMASLGAHGCAYEHPLESVHAALHNEIVENRGFLRDDALLVVIFVTDEDDASAPPDTDLFDNDATARYGFPSSYSRQVRYGVLCGDPPAPPPYGDSHGPLDHCRPAPNPDGAGPGRLFDVHRYVDFFTSPRASGGIKDDAGDVMLAAIDGPEGPFSVILAHPALRPDLPLERCSAVDESSSPPCLPTLERSCINDAGIYGVSAVRLNAVVRAAARHDISSLCEDDYGTNLERIGHRIAAALDLVACVPDPLPRDADCQLVSDCQVTDITLNADGTETRTPIIRCGQGELPCWVMEVVSECAERSPDSATIRVERGRVDGVPVAAPPHTAPIFECAAAP